MHSKSTFLILILSLVSVVCAVPLHADSRLEVRAGFTIICTFLEQASPLDRTSHPRTATPASNVPEQVQSMLKELTLNELGRPTDTIEWQFFAYDDSYQKIVEGSPVYFELAGLGALGGLGACKKQRACLGFVRKDSGGSLHGIIARPAKGNFVVKGDALSFTGVSFTKKPEVATGLEKLNAGAHAQAENMVKWAFTNLPELKTSLEFHQTPTIFFSNQFPYEGIPLGVSLGFQLFGGTQCTLYKPCNGLIQLNPDPQKTPYVLISTGVTGAPIFKTGTSLPEARVSFIKPVQGGPEVVPMADTIARNLVKWLLEQQKVVTALGFSQSPKVIYLDQFLFKVIEKKSAVHFQFHGGKKCTPVLPCYGLVGIDHTKEPHPLRYGSVYDYNYLSGHSERKPIVLVGEEP